MQSGRFRPGQPITRFVIVAQLSPDRHPLRDGCQRSRDECPDKDLFRPTGCSMTARRGVGPGEIMRWAPTRGAPARPRPPAYVHCANRIPKRAVPEAGPTRCGPAEIPFAPSAKGVAYVQLPGRLAPSWAPTAVVLQGSARSRTRGGGSDGECVVERRLRGERGTVLMCAGISRLCPSA